MAGIFSPYMAQQGQMMRSPFGMGGGMQSSYAPGVSGPISYGGDAVARPIPGGRGGQMRPMPSDGLRAPQPQAAPAGMPQAKFDRQMARQNAGQASQGPAFARQPQPPQAPNRWNEQIPSQMLEQLKGAVIRDPTGQVPDRPLSGFGQPGASYPTGMGPKDQNGGFGSFQDMKGRLNPDGSYGGYANPPGGQPVGNNGLSGFEGTLGGFNPNFQQQGPQPQQPMQQMTAQLQGLRSQMQPQQQAQIQARPMPPQQPQQQQPGSGLAAGFLGNFMQGGGQPKPMQPLQQQYQPPRSAYDF